MPRLLATLTLLTLALLLLAFPYTPARAADDKPQAVNLILTNPEGQEVAKFIMEITPSKDAEQNLSGKLTTSWTSPKFKNAGACGTTFSATLHKDDFSANLNPGVADDNVMLSGKKSGNKITGEWSFSSFVGSKTLGKFTLTLSAE